MRITFEDVKNNKVVQTYIKKADESLSALGYTEHSFDGCVCTVCYTSNHSCDSYGNCDICGEWVRMSSI